jgi:hypothetical protein
MWVHWVPMITTPEVLLELAPNISRQLRGLHRNASTKRGVVFLDESI